MGVFVQLPFWATGYRRRVAPHAVSVLVTPEVAIATSSVANPTVITTMTPHGLTSGDTVAIAGHTGSTPAVDGSRVVTVLGPSSFSIPVNVTVAGAGGTVTRTLAIEPLTLDEAKLRAGLDWTLGDPRDALMTGFIAAARAKVEQDTGLALLTQTRDVYLDAVYDRTIVLPPQSMPLQAVTSVKTWDTAGVQNTLDPSNYVVDLPSARLGLALAGYWPTDLRPFQPWVIRIVAGYLDVNALTTAAPLLVHAVGLLVAHFATLGRDLASVNQVTEVPCGYEDAIAPYVQVSVA